MKKQKYLLKLVTKCLQNGQQACTVNMSVNQLNMEVTSSVHLKC